MGAVLEVTDLVAGYGDATILHGVSVHLDQGEIVVVIGPNGAGKSTLIKAVAGLIEPSSGRVVLDGQEVSGFPPQTIVGMGMSYVPQVRNTFTSLTVQENLEMGAYVFNYGTSGFIGSLVASAADGLREQLFKHPPRRFYSAARIPASVIRDRMDRVLELFPVLKSRRNVRAGDLSGGQQQMVALARAMMLDPKVLLIDEPSAGLAPNLVDAIFSRIAVINKQGTSILLVEQNARKALKLASRGYVLEMGRNRFEDRADRVLTNPEIGKLYLGG